MVHNNPTSNVKVLKHVTELLVLSKHQTDSCKANVCSHLLHTLARKQV